MTLFDCKVLWMVVRVAAFFEKLGQFVTFVAKTNLLLKLNTYFLYHHSFHSNATKT